MEYEGNEALHQHAKRKKPTKHSPFSSTSKQVSSFRTPILPQELITEILSRLPVKSLLKFTCVSKSWLALISSPQFVKTHLSVSVNNKECTNHRLMWSFGPELNLKECTLTSLFDEFVTEVFDLDYRMISDGLYNNLPDSEMILGSVHGLICLADKNGDLFLWNPSIRKYKKVPIPISPLSFSQWQIYGFGYDKFHNDYKVVATFLKYGSFSQGELRIYSLKSDSWRRVDDCQIGLRINVSGKFVNGKLHWPSSAFDGVCFLYTDGNFLYEGWNIISFDLANEKWGKVEQPFYGKGEDISVLLGVLGSDLSIFCDCGGTHVDVWVMKEYGVKESWTKMCTIKYPGDQVGYGNLFSLHYFMLSKGEILVAFNSTSMIYNPKDDSSRILEVINFDNNPKAEIYIESLVCPFSREGNEGATKSKRMKKLISR
ncbi:F-box/kelch-repeat protein At3g23880-like isoform X1 [Lycium barbarum]|uniref:F-box/kelch-repeat protein At3g23880-like isoform X1 n=1 Tax=Lycium barbarum TaxID=112863 RepID=UPI00293F6840|nr:F-box/kelch-repeat protein At3g23880-like isoform X1 [Lycium barbarum]XP_060180930.1 F-box/kelch-repeat protein At3g23880-like isoform X1 [Lycium barbarum]